MKELIMIFFKTENRMIRFAIIMFMLGFMCAFGYLKAKTIEKDILDLKEIVKVIPNIQQTLAKIDGYLEGKKNGKFR